ncbi:MAG: competence/damage-inducible protein A, partial [Candidatus Latescibacteria bacterium]|nr:competence/damage-inducible protein A [Candidatus Latescibacterota bacterium]
RRGRPPGRRVHERRAAAHGAASAGMIAEVITIGSELLHGLVRNTNLDMIAGMLGEIGLEPAFHSTVGDDAEHMGEAFRTAAHRSEIVISTGGLGPTPDDITRKVIATVFRRRLILDQAVLEAIRTRFRARGIEMPPINETQALIPRGSTVIQNRRGIAPGLHFSHLRTEIFALPGVPSEAEQMLRDYVLPRLRSLNPGLQSALRVVRTIGISESALSERLQGFAMEEPELSLGYIASTTGVDLHLAGSSRDPRLLAERLDRAERKLLERAGAHAYARGHRTLSEVVGEALLERGLTIATAESFTGGALGAAVIATPGSSRYYRGGVVAYSNDAKAALLGVSEAVLRVKGAVSAEAARAMARGARERLRASCAVSTTGIAGPEGGSEEKPVGLVYIGYSGADSETSERFLFGGSRAEIVARGCSCALDLLRRSIGAPPP